MLSGDGKRKNWGKNEKVGLEIWRWENYFVILWAEKQINTHNTMAKYDLGEQGTAIHGRADRRSGDYFRTIKRTGNVYLIHRDPTKKSEAKPGQTAARNRFREISKACTEFVREGKEAVARREPSALAEAYLAAYAAFNGQKNVTFLRSYVMKFYATWMEEGKVQLQVDDFVKVYEVKY